MMMTAIIQTEGLTKHFGSHHAVNQLSIEVNPGKSTDSSD